MRKIHFVITCLLACTLTSVNSQNAGYFQQEVNYNIDVTLDDENHILRGFESFDYLNNSPNSLDFLYIHIWPNAYKNGETALARQLARMGNYTLKDPKEGDLGYIDSLNFKVNDEVVKWELDSENIDICKVYLNSPLSPGETITVSTPFKVQIPSGRISRLGHIGQSYQITQWYPKPAVYDENGWNTMPYLTQGEFYSEFGSFDVSITLPKNYVIGATGDKIDGEEEVQFLEDKIDFTKNYLKDPDNPQFASLNKNEFPKSDKETKTVRFYQENVHDFAWFADKRYLVLKGEVELPISKRKVETWALFTTDDADLWEKSIEYLNDATYYYSLWNGEYPYNHVTAVDGTISAGGGMEYPNITVIGSSGSDKGLEVVIMHEVGHNWFYGILGSNERVHAWMDEGINSYNETRYMEHKYPDYNMLAIFVGEDIIKNKDPRQTYKAGDQFMYMLTAGNYADQPMQIHSDDYSNINYGAIVYKKTAFVFGYLAQYLGQETFDQCMHIYFETWKFKHPKPKDIRAIFEKESGKDLSWFFEDIVKTSKKIDFKICHIEDLKDGTYKVTVQNTGEISAPFSVGTIEPEKLISNDISWFDPLEVGVKTDVIIKAEKKDRISIDPNGEMPDFNRQNNISKTSGILKKVEPVSLKLGLRLNDGQKSQVFWVPLWAWNEYDKNMLGVNIHNTVIPLKSFEYSITPLYSFSENELNGFARFSYYRENTQFHLRGQSFTEISNRLLDQKYLLISPEVKIKLKTPLRSRKNRSLTLKSNYIQKYQTTYADDDTETVFSEAPYHFVNEVKFNMSYSNISSKYDIEFKVQQIIEDWGNYLYPISVESNYTIKDKRGKDQFIIRAFAGKYIEASNSAAYRWNTNGQNGLNDYEYDGLYLGRTETSDLLSRQTYANQGGLLKSFGTSGNNWMISGQVDYKLPIGLPLYLYMGAALLDNRDFVEGSSEWDIDYAGGISFKTGAFNINIPLVYPDLFEDGNDISIIDAISFEIYLESLNPNKILRNNLK